MPAVALTNVSTHGFWLLWNGEEHFLAFEDFPWFRDACISALSNIEVQGAEHLYWPELEVDLSLAIIKRPGGLSAGGERVVMNKGVNDSCLLQTYFFDTFFIANRSPV